MRATCSTLSEARKLVESSVSQHAGHAEHHVCDTACAETWRICCHVCEVWQQHNMRRRLLCANHVGSKACWVMNGGYASAGKVSECQSSCLSGPTSGACCNRAQAGGYCQLAKVPPMSVASLLWRRVVPALLCAAPLRVACTICA